MDLTDAVKRHLAAVLEADPVERQSAGRDLVEALDAYGAALANHGADVPDELGAFPSWLDEEDGVELPDPEPDLRQRVALFSRTDLAVADPELLRSTAVERLADCCGDVFDDLDEAVHAPVDAVGHVFGHRPTSLEPDDVERFGLEVLSGTTVAVAVDADTDTALEDPWAPLREPDDDDDT